jgi:hypothetical protein
MLDAFDFSLGRHYVAYLYGLISNDMTENTHTVPFSAMGFLIYYFITIRETYKVDV